MESMELNESVKVLRETDFRRETFFSQQELELDSAGIENNIVLSCQFRFDGFLFSLVDSVPSEIVVVSIEGLHAVGKWNMMRIGDATALISIA